MSYSETQAPKRQRLDHRRRNALKSVLALERAGFEAFLAGGCVRDELLGKKPKDFDIATSATPDQVTKTFQGLGGKVIPTGLDHGTVTLVIDGQPIEITTFRKDLETDGRHAVVDFGGATLKDDAERRDFTINAMYQSSEGKLTDFFGGQDDLSRKRLRFVGDAEARIREDYLRILRLYRFWAKLGFMPNEDALAATHKLCSGLSQISQERITSELLEMLSGDTVDAALSNMVQSGVQEVILPDLKLRGDTLLSLTAFTHEDLALKSLGRLWLLLQSSKTTLDLPALCLKLRLPNHFTKALSCLNRFSSQAPGFASQADYMAYTDQCEAVLGKGSFMPFYGPLWLIAHRQDSALLALAEKALKTEELKRHIRLATMPLSSETVMTELALDPGPALGATLQALKEGFRNELWYSAEEGIRYIKKIVRETSSIDAD